VLSVEHSPTVSVITPAFNSAVYLAEAVDSVIAQSFADFELLIVDDGSTDATVSIARRLAERDARVRVIAARHAGVSAARNAAMRAARGGYLALLDSDDVWSRDFLAAQMAIFRDLAPVDVVTGNACNLGGPLDGQALHPVGPGPRWISLLDMIERESAVCIMSVFRRAVFETIGGFDETLDRSEDYEFWIRAAAAGFQFVENPKPLARYRRRADGASADDQQMLSGITCVLRRTRVLRAGCPAEIAAIDRQLARFERQQLLDRAKAHLLDGEYGPAADDFETLSNLTRDFASGVIAHVSRRAPGMLRWAYLARKRLREAPAGG
jgi:hypothetical protein